MTIEGGVTQYIFIHRENGEDCAISSSWIRHSSNKRTPFERRSPIVLIRLSECCMIYFTLKYWHRRSLAVAINRLQTCSQTYRELVATAIDCRREACNRCSAFSMTDYSPSHGDRMYHARHSRRAEQPRDLTTLPTSSDLRVVVKSCDTSELP